MGKLLEDAAADVVTLCTLGVHPGAGTDHVPSYMYNSAIIPCPQTDIGKRKRNLKF